MLEINDKTNYINVFDNITELAKYVSEKKHKSGREYDSQTKGDEEDFYGTESFEEALDLLRYGDEELYNSINIERKKINIDKIIGAINQRQKYEKRIYGCVPNVPAYLKGDPLSMINAEKSRPGNKILNIFLNIRVGAGTSTETIKEIGTKYLSIIDILEKNGYRCNLYSGCANEYCGKHSYLLVRIKTDKEPLNLKKICFTIAHPSMQRRIKFRWMEVNDFEQDFTDGYGHTDNMDYTKNVLDKKLKDNFIIWTYEYNNKSKTIKELLKELKEKYEIRIGE